MEEYIDFFARAYGLRGQKRRQSVEGVIEFTNLSGIRWKMIGDCSKGMKQRVSLARALVHNPSVLVMDEPAAGLDPRARVELRELLKILRAQGKAILVSSHILTELSEICTGAVIIERGRILHAGSIDDLTSQNARENKQSIKIRALGMDAAALTKLLIEMPLVETAVPFGENKGEVHVVTQRDEQKAASLLKMLVERGVPIVEFSPKRADLEDVFMAITEGKVQ